MRTSIIVATLFALTLFVDSAMSQGASSSSTLLCPTSDGTVIIDNETIVLRDYVLTYDQETTAGTMLFSDPSCDATAELDTRGAEGVYLKIIEGGLTMLVVADRDKIIVTNVPPSSEPASPDFSALQKHVASRLSDGPNQR